MKTIGILSDTHGTVDARLYDFFAPCQELWHAGDMGGLEVADELAAFRPLRGVYGNMDGWDVRGVYPEVQRFMCEDVDVLMVHIGGYPGRYEPTVESMIRAKAPQLFVCGHSHILKVVNCPRYHLLHINPGAMGFSGIHQVRTAVRLVVDGGRMHDLEVLELPRSRTAPGVS